MTDELEERISLKMESGISYDLALQQALEESNARSCKAMLEFASRRKVKK